MGTPAPHHYLSQIFGEPLPGSSMANELSTSYLRYGNMWDESQLE